MWPRKKKKVTSLLQNLQYHARLAPRGHQWHPEITPGVLGQNEIKLAQRLNQVSQTPRLHFGGQNGPWVSKAMFMLPYLTINQLFYKKYFFFPVPLVWSLPSTGLLLLGLSIRPKTRFYKSPKWDQAPVLCKENISFSGLAANKKLTFFRSVTLRRNGAVLCISREKLSLCSP